MLNKKIPSLFLSGLFFFNLFSLHASDDKIYALLLDQMSSNLRSGNPLSDEKKTLSLEECLQLSLEKSGKLHIAKEEYKLALLNYEHCRRDLYPKFDVKYEKVDGTTTGEDFRGQGEKLEMQYPLYGGGRLRKLFEQSKLNLEIARLKHDQTLIEVFTETEKAFYVWIEAKSRVWAASQMEKIAGEALEVEKKRFDQKLSRDIDWMETKIYDEDVSQKVSEAKNDLKLAEFSLRQVLDLYTGDFDIQSADQSMEIQMKAEELIPRALDKRPDLKMNRLLEKVNRFNREIAAADSGLQVNLDGFGGRRAENFVSEKLKYESEYYVGVSASLPIGRNTLETQVIKQNTVPSAGQTTSTEFTSESVKFNILDNKFDSSKLEGLIKYYQAIEDNERVKKAAIFELGKTYLEVLKAHAHLEMAKQKLELSRKKLEFEKLSLAKNEANVNDYLKEAVASFEAETGYSKALSGYFTSVSDLNKALGSPGYFNASTGGTGPDYLDKFNATPSSGKSFLKSLFADTREDDPYYPKRSYEDLKFKATDAGGKSLFWKKEKTYTDPIEEKEKEKSHSSWWKFWGKK